MDGIWEGLEKEKGKEKHNYNIKSKKLFCLKLFKKNSKVNFKTCEAECHGSFLSLKGRNIMSSRSSSAT